MKSITYRAPLAVVIKASQICEEQGCTLYAAVAEEIAALPENIGLYKNRPAERMKRIPGPPCIIMSSAIGKEKEDQIKAAAKSAGHSIASICRLYVRDIAEKRKKPPEKAADRPQRTDVQPPHKRYRQTTDT